METDGVDDPSASHMEINISNTNADSQIVLNDLRLLELLYLYPYIFSPQVRPQDDEDYIEWGWEQITKAFNISYDGLELSAPFSVEELQWRWSILQPLMGTLSKACGQIPDCLWFIIVKINQMMNAEKPANTKLAPYHERFLMQHLPLVESLTETQRRRMEVEVLDLIFGHEAKMKAPKILTKKQNDMVQSEYEEFLKAIRVKELPPDTLQRLASVGFGTQPEPSATDLGELPAPSGANIVNSKQSNLVISGVYSAQPVGAPPMVVVAAPPPSPPPPPTPQPPSPLTQVKQEPMDHLESQPSAILPDVTPPDTLQVPLKSAKYYVKKLRVRVKRIELDDYLPLATIRKNSFV